MNHAAFVQLVAVVVSLLVGNSSLSAPLGTDDARHLLNRAGFGATPEDISVYSHFSRTQAVDRLLDNIPAQPLRPVPAAVDQFIPRSVFRDADADEKKALVRQLYVNGAEMRTWWVGTMLDADTPPEQLREHMTLFWHNHFTSSQEKVKSTRLLMDQNRLLRRYALGNFSELLHAVGKDPAMVVYLDSATNRRGQPNENFAREVMELFTLGEGHYSEQDIKEAARAFTGWSIDPDTGAYKWRLFAHDSGVKTVLAKSGNFDGDDVLDILLSQRETAEFVMRKMWREFISPEPDEREVTRIATLFRDSGYDTKVALRELFLSPAFWSAKSRGSLIKSPVDLIVGTLHTLEIKVDDPLPFAISLRQLGQDLFGPPNVKGWPGGESWINSNTLLTRKQLLDRLLRNDESTGMSRAGLRDMLAGKDGKGVRGMGEEGRMRFVNALDSIHFDSVAWNQSLEKARLMPEQVLLATAPVSTTAGDMQGIDKVRALLLDPAYQLK